MYKKSSTSKGALIGAGVGAVAGGAANYFRKNKDERSAKDALIGAGVGAAAGGGIGAIAGHVNGKKRTPEAKNKDSHNKPLESAEKPIQPEKPTQQEKPIQPEKPTQQEKPIQLPTGNDNKQREVVTKGSAVERLKARMAKDRARRYTPPKIEREAMQSYKKLQKSEDPGIREASEKDRLNMIRRLRASNGTAGGFHRYRTVTHSGNRLKDEILERARSKRQET